MKKFLLSVGIWLAMFENLSAQQNGVFIKDNAAINGYDPVAYFREERPVKGSSNYSVQYKGAKWLFVNKSIADLFKANPGKYEPKYGGYCAFGCSRGYKAKKSPDAWTIVDGK